MCWFRHVVLSINLFSHEIVSASMREAQKNHNGTHTQNTQIENDSKSRTGLTRDWNNTNPHLEDAKLCHHVMPQNK